ncbi:MAG TPA: hypothetical protein VE219_02105 [Candidatus Sulfotelmatobacter sp.]|nr:hypothetical protein [Candidatus Sulfotelmatobacter sp.]
MTAALFLQAGPGATASAASLSITAANHSGACRGGGTQYCYDPEFAITETGTPTVWVNNTSTAHTVTDFATSPTGAESLSITVPAKGSASFTFAEPLVS